MADGEVISDRSHVIQPRSHLCLR